MADSIGLVPKLNNGTGRRDFWQTGVGQAAESDVGQMADRTS
jgi:hypothetical protein